MYLDFEANSEKEATQLALESLGLSISEVKIESISSGKKNFLGLGKKEKAKIRVYYKEKNEANEVVNTVKDLISKIDKDALLEVEESEENKYVVKVESAIPGRLIGKNGKILQAIQNIVNSISQKNGNKYKVLVDVSNYHHRIQKKVLFQARLQAKKVQRFKKPIVLDPLNPFLRRLVHMELQKFGGIQTRSEGEGKYKQITISTANHGNDWRRR